MMDDYRQNLQKCHEYVRALEVEKRKIEMFRRELPLCLEIVSQALETCKQQLSGNMTRTTTTTTTGCSEQTTSDDPVFEEFIPLKKTCSEEEEEEEDIDVNEFESHGNSATNFNAKSDGVAMKSDWLRSAQLWNQSPDPPTTTISKEANLVADVPKLETRQGSGVEVKSSTTSATVEPAASACSTVEARKARRCWSPELHRRFIHALEQLGGPHVATPKQIRDLMKVDGLTNDEVKSHLQKYRLHTRRPTPAVENSKSTQEAPQLVVVGGIWAPPTTTTTTTAAPTPARLNQKARNHQAYAGGSQTESRCNSPATSSSARAATAYPAC